MIEKLNNILFHPSTLYEYRKTHLFKVILYLLILSFFSILVPIIDRIKEPELKMNDKEYIEELTGFSFDVSENLPDCRLDDHVYSCTESESREIGTVLGRFKILSDVEDTERTTDLDYYIKLTEEGIIIDSIGFRTLIPYDKLPSKWQSFDFEEIKTSDNPSDELYRLFIGGFNQILVKFTPIIIAFNVFIIFIVKTLEILLYSLLFYLFYRRFEFKYRELFKITVFAQSLPVVLALIFDLLQFNIFSSFFSTMLTFIYVYIAVMQKIPRDREF